MKSWPLVELGEIFSIARGGSPRPIDKFITEDPNGINWVMIGDASKNSKYITETTKKIKPSGVSRSRIVKPGDFLLTNSMSFGHPYIMKIDGCIHDGWLVLSPQINNVDHNYFFHLLGSDGVYSEFEKRASGATVKNLNIDLVKSVKVPLPPLEEQKRIAAILDQSDELRRLRQRAIDRLNELGQAIFYEMFGEWDQPGSQQPLVKLGSVLEFLTSGSRGWAKYYRDAGSLFLRIQNVRHDHLDLSDIAYVEPPDTAEATRTRVQAGDVLLSITADLGRTAVVPPNLGEAFINQHLSILRTKYFLPRYLSAALSSPAGQRVVQRRNREGVKAGLNFDDIRSFEIPDVNLENQKLFTESMGRLDMLKSKLLADSIHTQRLFESLQHNAFN